MKSIIVINDISEDSLFGSEDPPAGYDAQQLQTMLKTRLDAMYPGVDVQVWDSDSKTEVQVDGDDWEVESQVMETISQVHEIWLDQLNFSKRMINWITTTGNDQVATKGTDEDGNKYQSPANGETVYCTTFDGFKGCGWTAAQALASAIEERDSGEAEAASTLPLRELKNADGILIGWIREEAKGTFKKMVGGEWQQLCPCCGEYDPGPHAKCSKEVDTIKAPAGAELGDYVWFHQRSKDLGYDMAVMPADR